jgi:hypothetical protein
MLPNRHHPGADGVPSGMLKTLDVRRDQTAWKRPARRQISCSLVAGRQERLVQPSGMILSPANSLTVA